MPESIIVDARRAVLGMLIGIGLGACERQTPAEAPTAAAIETSLVAAEQYLAAGNTASAAMILEALLGKAPRESRAHELYGQVLYLKGMAAGAVGDDTLAARLVSEAYDQYRAAVETAEDSSGLGPLTIAGLNQSAGEIASAAGRPKQALEHFRTAGRLDPTTPKAPLYEAQLLIQLGRPEEADLALQRVLRLDPDEAYAHASLAALALQRADRDSAVRHITVARRIDPGNIALRLQQARIFRLCDEPRRALEVLLALDDSARTEEPITAEVAECYHRLNEPGKAAAAWELRYRLHPGHPTAWRAAVRAAAARLEAGDRDRARWLYERARLHAPEEAEVRALGEVMEGNKKGRRGEGAQGRRE